MPVSFICRRVWLSIGQTLTIYQLIIISGYPCAGKTRRAHQLAAHFESRIAAAPANTADGPRSVVLINDQTLDVHRQAYATAGSEKEARAAHSSAIKRAIGRRVIVIADGLHYIKGFRYQLYCEAKAARTPSCVVSTSMVPWWSCTSG